MGRIADSTYQIQMAEHLGESQVVRHLTRLWSANSRPTRTKRAAETVVDDFPEATPVTVRELEVIETYLSAVLDECLGATDS